MTPQREIELEEQREIQRQTRILNRYPCTSDGVRCDPDFNARCVNCGFHVEEAARRKALPLVDLPNGLRGKRIPPRRY